MNGRVHCSADAIKVTETCFSGVYNETAFRALDLILDTAAYNGVKIIFTMGDNWQSADSKMNVSYYHPLQPQTKLARSTFCFTLPAGVYLTAALLQYNMWAGFNESSDQFWTSNVTREMYKDHMKVMVNRVNTLNGAANVDFGFRPLFSCARLIGSALLRTACVLTDGVLLRRALRG